MEINKTRRFIAGVAGGRHLLPWTGLVCLVLTGALIGAVPVQAGTATIGGAMWSGSYDPDGIGPNLSPGPADAITDLAGAVAMVQSMDSGAFVAYGTFTPGTNDWTAVVPTPDAALDPMDPATWQDYVVMFSAPDHSFTSRAYRVSNGDTVTQDAFLPPLPLPKGRLLAYAFLDNIVNGADDFPMDPGLAGVLLEVLDENGQVVMSGVTGSQHPSVFPLMAGPDFNGLYYFTGPTALEPGEYIVRATPPAPLPGTTGWYHTTTEEGFQEWEAIIRPNDSGTEDGFYLIWYGFAPKLPSSVDPADPEAATISGRMIDADGNDPEEPLPPGKPCVSQNFEVLEGWGVLYGLCEDNGPCGPAASTLADPVTGDFAFTDVPPGKYKIFASDLPMEYVFNMLEVTVTANQDVADLEIWMARFMGRVYGFVQDDFGNPIAGAKVVLRLDPGSVWEETTSQADGSYRFNALVEVETLGLLEVEPPPGYRAMHVDPDPLDPDRDTDCVALTGKHGNRYVMFFSGLNHRADLFVEPVPVASGDIRGFTYYDTPTPPSWLSDGVWQEDVEPTLQGVTINLLDVTGSTVIATTTSAFFDEAGAIAQGWQPPFTAVPVDFWGGVYNGPIPAFYEFLDIAAGDYLLQVVPPLGYVLPPLAAPTVPVTVTTGSAVDLDFGLTTLAPSSGLIAGAVFDDMNVDANPLSIWFDEKAFIVGAPVTVFDHFGYVIDSFVQPSQWCWPGAQGDPPNPALPPCDRPDLGPTVEILRRLAPGPHEYLGNDPNHPAYNPNYVPMPLNYTFPQGGAKFEADWSLVPAQMCTIEGNPVPFGEYCEWPGGNPCIAGMCDGQGTCIEQFLTEIICDDGLFCNGVGTCIGGGCSMQSGNPCSFGPECANSCNEITNDCFNPLGTPCSDDGDPCTDNLCDGFGSCVAVLNAAPCDDLDACTAPDLCDNGVCVGSAPVVCTASDQCHGVGVCDVVTECSDPVLPDGSLCDDGNPCTDGDSCTAGVCGTGSLPADCDDGNPCTDDTCDLALGCTHTPTLGVCDDGDPCTFDEVCVAGACTGSAVDCTELDDSCQQGVCNAASGECEPQPIVDCTYLDQYGIVGVCNPATALCEVSECATSVIGGNDPSLAAPDGTVEVDLIVDVGSVPLGAHTFRLSWDASALRLDGVTGGSTFEFSGPPICNIDNVAGTATCSAFQAIFVLSPVGQVHIATAQMTVLAGSDDDESILLSVDSYFGTYDGTPMMLCNASDELVVSRSPGDVNADAAINVIDAMLVAQYTVGLRDCADIERFDMCDVHPGLPEGPDGACTIVDALKMAQCSVGLIPCNFSCGAVSCP